jgi:hypothetical protein
MINATEILNFISQYFNDKELSQHAIHTFYTLSNKIHSPNQQFWELLLKILCQDILTLHNPINLEKVVSIGFRIILKEQEFETLFMTILRNSLLSLQTPATLINDMILISSILTHFN